MTECSAATDTRLNSDQVLLKVDERVRFALGIDHIIVEHVGRGLRKELPLSSLTLLAQFANWTPISHAFSDPNQDLGLTFSLVRELVSCGIFVRKEGWTPGCRASGEQWSPWGGALLYHLESRTTANTRYRTTDETIALLTQKAKDHPRPASFKDYPLQAFYSLPNPEAGGRCREFLEVLLTRRTCRSFSRDPLSATQLSTLLYFAWGCTAVWLTRLGGEALPMKTAPSGGSTHSVEVYPILLNVSGLPSGIYHYSVRNHGLEMLSREDPTAWLGKSCGDQEWVSSCGAVFVMTALVQRIMWKYTDPRAYRVLLFDIGHVSQTFALVATHLGLGSFATAALRDEVLEQKLGLPYLQEPIFLATGVGIPVAGA